MANMAPKPNVYLAMVPYYVIWYMTYSCLGYGSPSPGIAIRCYRTKVTAVS
jgi:hypothetical protein